MKKNWLEWTVFAASLALIAGMLGYLVRDAATVGNAPADIEIRLGRPERRSQHFVIPVSIFNHGDRAAEDVRVEVVLSSGGEEREKAEVQFWMVPRGARREGFVAFATDPETAERVSGRVLGYEEP